MTRRSPALRGLVALALGLAVSMMSAGIALADGGIGPLPH